MRLSDRLLQSCGAVLPGLVDCGLPAAAVRHAWAALAYGRWDTAWLLAARQHVVQDDSALVAPQHGGYRPVACDLVGCRCPRLQGCPTRHDCAQTGKPLPATSLGTAARIGSVGTQRLAIPCRRVCPEATEAGEAARQRRLLQQVQTLLAPDEAFVTDRGFPLAQRHEQGSGISAVGPPILLPGVPATPVQRQGLPTDARPPGPSAAANLQEPNGCGYLTRPA